MNVREVEPTERAEVRELLRTAYGQYASAVPVVELFQRYLAGVTDGDGADWGDDAAATLVVESAGRIAGTARFYPAGAVPDLPAGWAWVRAVAVHPRARGAGLARRLMAECRRRAIAGGARVLCLHTMTFMPDAVRLYERLGYRRVPELDIDVAKGYGVGGEMIALGYRLDLES
jgi:GNAT superfamily N-acetyltransferase